MKITFWGAARTVTGSMHLVEAGGKRYLLDCGMFQGRRKEAEQRNRKLPDARSIDAVLVSHAHTDHTGNLPQLVKHGFSGPIYATPPTITLCDSMLRDTAHILEKDAEFVNKRRQKRANGKKQEPLESEEAVEPLFTMEDAERTLPLFRPVPYYTPQEIDGRTAYECYDAGHMLGSSCIVIHHRENGRRIRLAYSGDIGRPRLPIIRDPDTLPPAEYLIMESTYGGRLHKTNEHVANKLADTIIRTAKRGGRVIVPAFAVGRTQQLVLLLHQLTDEGRIPNLPMFVDSPLAINVTEAHRKHIEVYDAETRQYLLDGQNPFGFGRLQYVREASESRKLNDMRVPFVVIAASGMCEAGRILHHLRNNIEDPRNTVLITGFQAENTLGRKLVERQPEVNIFGEPFRLRAEVVSLDELSGHGDQGELMTWLKPLAPNLKKVFLVHGEVTQSETLAELIRKEHGLEVFVPAPGDSFELD